MRNALIAVLFTFVFATAQAADTSTPEGTLMAPIEALRNNDVPAIFALIPEEAQAEAKKSWEEEAKNPNAAQDAEIDQNLGKLLAPDAIDTMMADLEPQLKEFNAQQVSMGLMMMGGMLAMNMAKDPEQAQSAQELQGLITDICAWLPASGLGDPAKARQAIERIVAGAKALDIANATELRALSLDEALKRCGGFLIELKNALAVYNLNADGFLDSIKVASVEGDGDQRTATMQFTAFGKPHSFPVKMEKKDGRWQVSESSMAGNPLTGGLGGMIPGVGGTGDLQIDDPADDPMQKADQP
jgi:hypothetical protein